MTLHDIHAKRILVLDYGSQYTQLIARRIREAGVYCELHPCDMDEAAIQAYQPSGIVLSGGPESVKLSSAHRIPEVVLQLGVPVLGICYGMQVMAEQLGGQVAEADHREFGYAEVKVEGEGFLLSGMMDQSSARGAAFLDVWMSHGDQVIQMPDGFQLMASTPSCPIAGMADPRRHFYGIQFHPEVTHTKQGFEILTRFVREICQCDGLWTAKNIVQDLLDKIRDQVGDHRVLLGLSGGVDSSVVAALLHKAIGDQLTCVFVDNGLLRHHEGDQVMEMFASHMGIHVIRSDSAELFLSRLQGINDPEEKRKIIGAAFIDVFQQASQKLDGIEYLAQGTIYPDVIESAAAGSGKAHVIKSHHNVGGLPERLGFKLVEPLRELFKDEVRAIGIELGLPYDMVYRHPFPGPGLAVRILGEIKPEYVRILQKADDIFIQALRDAQLYHKVSQAFAVFLPVKSVGVTGDGRRYEWVVALRAVETVDFMTARWAHLPYELLEQVSHTIVNTLEHVSRVVYDISGKPPSTIEWE